MSELTVEDLVKEGHLGALRPDDLRAVAAWAGAYDVDGDDEADRDSTPWAMARAVAWLRAEADRRDRAALELRLMRRIARETGRPANDPAVRAAVRRHVRGES